MPPHTYTPERLRVLGDQILAMLVAGGPMSNADVWLALRGAVNEVQTRRVLEQLVADGRATAQSVSRRLATPQGERLATARLYSAVPVPAKPKRRTRPA